MVSRFHVFSVLAGLGLLFLPGAAPAQVTAAAGYVLGARLLSDGTQGCVAAGAGGTFVGIGPGNFGTPAESSIVHVSESGVERVVATAFNSIADCLYDAAADTLYVLDNGGEFAGATTGDTVFALTSASTTTAATADGNELVAANSIADPAGIAMDAAGDLYITDATGPGAGSVWRYSGGSLSLFIAAAFDYVGAVSVDDSGNLYIAEALNPNFDQQISIYDASGSFVSTFAAASYSHGSVDSVFTAGGDLLVTGGTVIASLDGAASATSLLSWGGGGFPFGGGVTIQPFTGRIDFGFSTFSGDPVDSSLHSLVPFASLFPGRGKSSTECVHEFYGVTLVPAKPGKPAKNAICEDGAACDADGVVNDVCVFPVGSCLNVSDSRFGDCTATDTASYELLKSKPESAALAAMAGEIQAAAPVASSQCWFSDGVSVPVKITGSGRRRPGKGLVKVKVSSGDAKPLKDADKVKLFCTPSAAQ